MATLITKVANVVSQGCPFRAGSETRCYSFLPKVLSSVFVVKPCAVLLCELAGPLHTPVAVITFIAMNVALCYS